MQLRIFDSKFENADSEPGSFVAILDTGVAEFEISDSEGQVSGALRETFMRCRGNWSLSAIGVDFRDVTGAVKTCPIAVRLPPGPPARPRRFRHSARFLEGRSAAPVIRSIQPWG